MVYCEMIMSLLYCHYLGKCVLIHVLSWVTLWLPLPILIRSTVKFHRCALHMYILHERVVLSPSCGNICVCVCIHLVATCWAELIITCLFPFHILSVLTLNICPIGQGPGGVCSQPEAGPAGGWAAGPQLPRIQGWGIAGQGPLFSSAFSFFMFYCIYGGDLLFFSDLCTDTELSLFFQCYGSYVTSTVQIFIFLYKLKPKI